MLPVEILPVQETIVLRARGSELLILPHHVKELKSRAKPRDFSQYFRAEALVNRPARKLFEAWLRKDETLWPRLYQTVHKEMTISEGDAEEKPATKTTKVSPPKEEKKAAKAKEEKEEKPKAKAKAKEEKEEKPKAKEAKAEKPVKAKEAKVGKDKPKAEAKAKAKTAKKK